MISSSSQLVETNQPAPMSAEQIELIKTQICRDATDDELKLFLHRCEVTRLDPFAGQIHAVKRWDYTQGREAMKIQVGIDGLRLAAERTGKYEGQIPPQWCGEDGVWRDVWTSREIPAAARAGVNRAGFPVPLIAVVHYDEVVQTKKNGEPNRFWGKMPRHMIEKCAEAKALRKAFPQELSGMFLHEELPEDEKIVVESSDTPVQEEAQTFAYTATTGQKQLLVKVLTELDIHDIEQMKKISSELAEHKVPCNHEDMKQFIEKAMEVEK